MLFFKKTTPAKPELNSILEPYYVYESCKASQTQRFAVGCEASEDS